MSKRAKDAQNITSTLRENNAVNAVRKKRDQTQKFFAITRATAQATDRLQNYSLTKLRDAELKSIYSLFAWVANQQSYAEETVQSMTAARFNVSDVADIQQSEYDEVIKFLIDMRIDEMRH